jgi:hypothetical protein
MATRYAVPRAQASFWTVVKEKAHVPYAPASP